ncbi:MAG TPA: transposase, partial [Bryobacteraceae bacterium]|nr:transposase [Bryobacteraceae bacterium]
MLPSGGTHAGGVPDAAQEALRDSVQEAPAEIKCVIEALQALLGVAQTTAATLVSELRSLSRFQSPLQLMGYSGLVAREHSSYAARRRLSECQKGAHKARVRFAAPNRHAQKGKAGFPPCEGKPASFPDPTVSLVQGLTGRS